MKGYVGERSGLDEETRMYREEATHCYYCGRKLGPTPSHQTVMDGATLPSARTCEHAKPIMRDGLDALSNIVIACWECNEQKGCLTAGEYLQQREENGLPLSTCEYRDAEVRRRQAIESQGPSWADK